MTMPFMGGPWASLTIPIYVGTWAGRPNPATLPDGTWMFVTNFGIGGSEWIVSAGTWRPANGFVTLYSRSTSVAAPFSVVTLAGATGAFTLPETLRIPAGMLVPGRSHLYLQMRWKRGIGTGPPLEPAVGTVNSSMRLGTSASVADPPMLALTVSAAANQDAFQAGNGWFANSTTMTRSSFMGWNAQSANAVTDISTNINTAADMFITQDFSAGTAGDVFKLLSYTVQLWG